MNLASVLLYPFALLLPVVGATEAGRTARSERAETGTVSVEPEAGSYAWPDELPDSPGGWPFSASAFDHVEPGDAWQVRIEQRMTIRVTPRAQMPSPPDMFVGMPGRDDDGPRFSERKIGKCLPMSGIAGVQPDGQSRLLLFMRDRRVIGAELERGCRAGAFYSGFLLSRTSDGQLCVDRDELLSRSGTTCKLTRIRQLVAVGR
ncbi:hypothetical protein ACLIMP_08020 [Novosphingobium aerophilum]|uniref:hypothetical protein n=1 Tax=Novosphingobium TaxID=165696 RepID=UPI0006C897E4|nr:MULTISPECIES: hypothetical protein [unclassified Novosphingobium]KPH60452.1 hypothetical protein ADT71_20490 [Novosphingobium sp. ST904]MPS67019.1 hypothetical protein [Novosphingobium sp.]TCM39958.1 hypothetical protein EDF59_105194 [Novosphingobium sp. ST904]WRT94173.1 hypothetical protein U9J33_06605 [Novosphingobium sp. RL4]